MAFKSIKKKSTTKKPLTAKERAKKRAAELNKLKKK